MKNVLVIDALADVTNHNQSVMNGVYHIKRIVTNIFTILQYDSVFEETMGLSYYDMDNLFLYFINYQLFNS